MSPENPWLPGSGSVIPPPSFHLGGCEKPKGELPPSRGGAPRYPQPQSDLGKPIDGCYSSPTGMARGMCTPRISTNGGTPRGPPVRMTTGANGPIHSVVDSARKHVVFQPRTPTVRTSPPSMSPRWARVSETDERPVNTSGAKELLTEAVIHSSSSMSRVMANGLAV